MIESRPAPPKRRPTVEDPWWIKTVLLVVAISFLFIFLLVPLITVFVSALQKGLGPYFATFGDPAAFAAIQLTLMVAAIAGEPDFRHMCRLGNCQIRFPGQKSSYHSH